MMGPEHMHQLYGGDIVDYVGVKKSKSTSIQSHPHTDDNIGEIYNTQIKGKPHIDTTGILPTSLNISLPAVERDPHFTKIDQQLTETLNAIAAQIGLSCDMSSPAQTSKSITIKQQTADDINTADSEVIRALEELKRLGAV